MITVTRAVPRYKGGTPQSQKKTTTETFAKLAVAIVVMNTHLMCALLKEKGVIFVKNGIILLKFVIQHLIMSEVNSKTER